MKAKLTRRLAPAVGLLGALGLFLVGPAAHATTYATGGIAGYQFNLCPQLGYTPPANNQIMVLEPCGQGNEQFHMNNTSYGSGWVDFVFSDTSHGSYCLADVEAAGYNGANMFMQGCNGKSNQAFELVCTPAVGLSGTWSSVQTPDGYALNDYGGHWASGDGFAQWAAEYPVPKSEIFDPMGYNTCSSGD